ncbi:MAG: hypothetical protein M1294_06800 [Firmicutes bacterium]|jgi:hypothetical protein|nr:hypothetical protein [Bacillota bacterium]MCL5014959.1 hypothetical protein [Bacillota bacterium]
MAAGVVAIGDIVISVTGKLPSLPIYLVPVLMAVIFFIMVVMRRVVRRKTGTP